MLMVAVITIAASCGSDSQEAQPDNVQSLVGKWQFKRFEGHFTQPNGSVKEVAWNTADTGLKLYWEFRSNGEFIATTSDKSEKGRWTLKVDKTDGTTIEEGWLTLSGFPEASSMSDILGTDELIYKIGITKVTTSNATYVSLVTEVDASKGRDGLKTMLVYRYEKL
jgi:hypothetical protein